MILLRLLVALLTIPLGLDLYLPVPEDNPITVEKVALGRRLFFDKRLSRDGSISCSTCHNPNRAFSTPLPVAIGIGGRQGHRNAPALINRGYGRAYFWDGRTPTLEQQVVEPIQNPNEMDLTLEEASSRLKLNTTTLSRALASYVRSILSGDSSYDRFINGERQSLSAEQQFGLQIFRGKGNCTACHVGPNFTDEQFHNTGVAWRDSRLTDEGRFAISGNRRDHGAFKTPTLREIARTAPYMHDGSMATLEDVIDFYSEGGRPNPSLDPEIRPRNFTPEEKRALIAFLQSLNGTVFQGYR
jgi:cytochrome c peroxidase